MKYSYIARKRIIISVFIFADLTSLAREVTNRTVGQMLQKEMGKSLPTRHVSYPVRVPGAHDATGDVRS